MSEDTRAALHEAIAAHLAARQDSGRADLIALGAGPEEAEAANKAAAAVTETEAAVRDAAQAHADAAEDKGTLIARFEALRDDPDADPAERNAAENELAARVQADRIIEGRPIAANVGG